MENEKQFNRTVPYFTLNKYFYLFSLLNFSIRKKIWNKKLEENEKIDKKLKRNWNFFGYLLVGMWYVKILTKLDSLNLVQETFSIYKYASQFIKFFLNLIHTQKLKYDPKFFKYNSMYKMNS